MVKRDRTSIRYHYRSQGPSDRWPGFVETYLRPMHPSTVDAPKKSYGIFSLPVIIGSLGFFVDIYDLLLFNIVRRASFKELGVPEDQMKNVGENILNWQMI